MAVMKGARSSHGLYYPFILNCRDKGEFLALKHLSVRY